MKSCTIYAIRNLINGRCYIGSTINMRKRTKIHIYYLERGTHPSYRLQNDWNLYGENSFSFEELEKCASKDRYKSEQAWIDSISSHLPENGYNISPTAKDNSGTKRRKITKQRISESLKGKPKTEEHRAKIAKLNRERSKKPVSKETRAKISKSLKGRVLAKSTLQKMIKSRRANGRPWHTKESRDRIRQAATGRVPSEETRRKLSEAGKGRKWTEAQRRKIASIERIPLSTETKEAISKKRGGKPFVVVAPDKKEYQYSLLSEAAKAHGLDKSNIHKCLIGKAKQTKGYHCCYK